jgi:acetyl-CoA acetyltransferase
MAATSNFLSLSRIPSRSPSLLFRYLSTTNPVAKNKVYVIGVGMTKFMKPLGAEGPSYIQMGKEAVEKALNDAKLPYSVVESAHAGYVFGDSTKGQRIMYEVGMTGIPVTNVNNNCATGSTALFGARNIVAGGLARCVLALGFEKMQKGSLQADASKEEHPVEKLIRGLIKQNGPPGEVPITPWMFGLAGQQHMRQYGTTAEHFAKVALKNHKHSVNNPNAQFQDEYTLEDILGAKEICPPLTKLQCSPTSDGAAAAILANEEFVKEHGLQDRAVEIIGMSMATDVATTFQDTIRMIGYDMAVRASKLAYEEAGITPEEAQVVELHDCFSTNELLTYEALGLCEEGRGGKLIDDGDVTYGGRWVVNPSGGLISKGHPLGATGLAQCTELTWQLRGEAEKRQVPGAHTAIQHNLGLGGAAVVTVYRRR